MQWCFILDELHVRCDSCMDFFAVDPGNDVGMEVADDYREGREAVMPDGRPVRSVSQIAMDGS